MKFRPLTITVLLSIAVSAAEAQGAAPSQMTVQGRLTDAGNVPLPPGATSLGFRIMDAPVGGTQVWPAMSYEFQMVTLGDNGLWTAQLGVGTPLTDGVFIDSVRWLEITVGMTIMPRVRLVTGPYAHRVSTVDGASGGAITSKVTIGPGNANPGDHAFAAGSNNTANGEFSVALGAFNWADERSTVGGGVGNSANANYATVSGGNASLVEADFGTVAGGASNEVTGPRGTVSGGSGNRASAEGAVIGGGGNNRARGLYSTVAGGGGATQADSNSALGTWSTVGGGTENVAGEWGATVAGGFVNLALDSVATIAGGVANSATGFASTVGGGSSNSAEGIYATVAGGIGNYVIDSCATVGGGGHNRVHGLFSTIAGGGSTLASDSNSIIGQWGTIGGGARNTIEQGYSGTVAGGYGNQAGHVGTVGGGGWNQARNAATVAGGESNIAVGLYAAIGGGNYNDALGDYSTIPGGEGNLATGRHSFAAGEGAHAHHDNSFVWSDGSNWLFDSAATTSSNQFIIMCSGNVGIGTSTPIDKLQVHNGNIRTNGCVIGTNLACPSDERLKAGISTMEHALERVGRLRGVEYQWNSEARQNRDLPDGPQIGLIAQEVRDVVPQAVIEQSDGYLAVDYARLVPLLIEGMKEQQKQIEMQQDQIDQLRKKLEQ